MGWKSWMIVVSVLWVVGTLWGQTRPNVIIVIPDDISWGSISYYTPNGPRTPNLDKLAGESVRFTDFHVSPTCSPSRAALMTGRHNDATGVWHTIFGRSQLRADEITMADVFKANGYATGMFFKWHLGDNYPFRPGDRGFEYVAWSKGGGVGQMPDYWGNTNLSGTFWVNDELVEMTDEDDGIPGAFTTNFFFNRAFEFMDQALADKKPFFAYIPTATAHSPHFTPPDATDGATNKTATIENIDKNFGRLMDYLDDKNIAENTILIYATDNGDGQNFFKAGKGSHYEGGHRVPLLWRWPAGGMGGTNGGDREMDILCAHYDLLPTFMDIIGMDDVPNRPADLAMHGVSVKTALDMDPSNDLPIFKTRTVTIDNMRTETLTKFKQVSVMKDNYNSQGEIVNKWRWVKNGNGAAEFYDVLDDPKQANNIAGNSAHNAIKAEMAQAYEDYWEIVTEKGDLYTRDIIGHPAEPVVRINSHDTHTGSVWNQGQVATGGSSGTFQAIEFAKAGTYHFDLRRWPKEIEEETSLTTAPTAKVFNGNTTPVAFPVASARLHIYNGNTDYVNEVKNAQANADGVKFTVNNIPKGPAFIRTDLYDGPNGTGKNLFRAFYTYAEPDVQDVWGCMTQGNPAYNASATVHNPDACETVSLKREIAHPKVLVSGLNVSIPNNEGYELDVYNIRGVKIHQQIGYGESVQSLAGLGLSTGLYILNVRGVGIQSLHQILAVK